MGSPKERFVELEKLLSKLHDGLAEEAEVKRIEELLSGDPETCEFYLDYTQMVATTELEVVAPQPLEVGAKTVPLAIAQSTALFYEGQDAFDGKNTRQILNPSWKPLPWFGVAAAILLFAGSLALFFGKKNPMSPTGSMAGEVTQNGVAVLMESVGAEFGGDLVPDPVNGMLPLGELQLEAGFAEIEFLGGARILLEGPAVFVIESENGGSLRSGRLRARVPEQVDDFSITAPQVEVADRGGEFGVSVSIEDDGELTEVHCFDGKVDVYNAGVRQVQANPTPWQTLSATQAMSVLPNGVSKPPAVPHRFHSFEMMAAKALEEADYRHERWRDYIDALHADKDIVALYSFEDQRPSERTLVNQAHYRDQFSHGGIVRCRWTSGRWPSKGALAFTRSADRVNIKGDKSYRSLSLATWVRIDGLSQPNVLLSSAQADLGAVRWSIEGDGGLAFQLHGKDPEKKSPSKVYRFQTESGKTEIDGWHHLAMVYDGEKGIVSHFIDGNLVSENMVSEPAMVPVVLGDAQIGNASENDSSGEAIARHTNGRIDEFAIFGRAMGAEEIAHMASFGPQG